MMVLVLRRYLNINISQYRVAPKFLDIFSGTRFEFCVNLSLSVYMNKKSVPEFIDMRSAEKYFEF